MEVTIRELSVVEDELLVELEDDFSPLSDAWWFIRDITGMKSESALRDASLLMVEDLLRDGRIVVGSIGGDGAFSRWTEDTDGAITRINREWDDLDGALPGAGEICWLALPKDA